MSNIIKDALKERIKQHEGYRLDTYIDTLGFKTGGYGHKMLPGEEAPKDREGWDKIFEEDFDKAWNLMEKLCIENDLDIPVKAKGILCEMIFQMGFAGVSKFKNMIRHLKNGNFPDAANEMLQSRWYRQTPTRADQLGLKWRTF